MSNSEDECDHDQDGSEMGNMEIYKSVSNYNGM